MTLLVPAGLAILMSVTTDAPLGAVGAAVVIVTVANILDAIDALGDLRRWLPTHYGAPLVMGSVIRPLGTGGLTRTIRYGNPPEE